MARAAAANAATVIDTTAESGGLAIPESLDQLLALDPPALARLYEGASVPRIADLSGDLRGRMLALVDLPPLLDRVGRAWAARRSFPWRGKSFAYQGGDSGSGVNRVIDDRLRLFTFTTFVGRSRAGEFDAVQLDYDHAKNPTFIRWIQDEVRQLRPGLWLGQAYLARPDSQPRLVLYFGLSR